MSKNDQRNWFVRHRGYRKSQVTSVWAEAKPCSNVRNQSSYAKHLMVFIRVKVLLKHCFEVLRHQSSSNLCLGEFPTGDWCLFLESIAAEKHIALSLVVLSSIRHCGALFCEQWYLRSAGGLLQVEGYSTTIGQAEWPQRETPNRGNIWIWTWFQ